MMKFTVTPHDLLYFGSGKPFNFGAQNMQTAFPPFPHTFAGAISTKLADELGIEKKEIIKTLFGPFVSYKDKIYIPKPLDLLKEKKKIENFEIETLTLKKQIPFINLQDTDLNDKIIGLLWLDDDQKDFEMFNAFLDLDGLIKWFNNEKINKSNILDKNELFFYESRIGIKMDYHINTVEGDDSLFRINFLRLKEDVSFIYFIDFNYEYFNPSNIKDDEKLEEFLNNKMKIVKFGGEMRTAYYDCENKNFNSFLNMEKPILQNGDLIKIYFFTPYILEKANIWEEFKDYGEFITGATSSITLGYNSKHYKKCSQQAIAAGSVIYLKVTNSQNVENLWLKPKSGAFIGSNLMIYTKIQGE